MVTVYLRDIGSIPLFELANRVAAGDMEARAILIRSNLRLCVHIANGYQHLGMSLNDLVQEASVGLMRAAERSRPGYGTKFSSYAGWWIRQSLMRALSKQSRVIRLPQFVVDSLSQLRRAEKDPDLTDEQLTRIGIAADQAMASS
jgi:RNA polymerase primary sigma factor